MPGGVLLVNTGSHTLEGGQYGKLTIQAGTGDTSGTNGGKTSGGRIGGAISVGISNAIFFGNQFAAGPFVAEPGTSGLVYVGNGEQAGFVMTNNGTANQYIVRLQVDGAGGWITITHGGSTSLARNMYDPASGDQRLLNGDLNLDAGKSLALGSANKKLGSSNSNLQLTNNEGAIQLSASSIIQSVVGGNVQTQQGNNTLGFFGKSPVSRPSAVAVDITAVHAALVSLGLIT